MATKKAATDNVTGRPSSRTAKSDRPGKGVSRAGDRPQRNAHSIGEFRDILGVLNKDPEWRYRWILSTLEFDKRVFDARRAGWEFVDATSEKDLIPGEYAVGKGNGVEGSFYRIPAGRRTKDEYLYLMRIPEDHALEVDAWKDDKIDDNETDLFRSRKVEEDAEKGQYNADSTISHEDRHRRA